jgi:hypothetical protein
MTKYKQAVPTLQGEEKVEVCWDHVELLSRAEICREFDGAEHVVLSSCFAGIYQGFRCNGWIRSEKSYLQTRLERLRVSLITLSV